MVSRESLLALVWASATLATRLIAEPISSRDLDTRQTDTKCPPSYTSQNGMNFTTYCTKNNPFNDAMDPFETDTMEDCMERCSRYWGKSEGCFGVVWREDKQCWLRNSTTGTANMVNDDGIHAALVESKDMQPLDKDCPAADLSTHTLGDIGYTVHCGKDVGGNDACWSGYPSCLPEPFKGFYHATSLEQCLQFCIDEHPLCRAVIYSPTLEIGFANCWPKTGFPSNLDSPGPGRGTMHAATITSLDRIDTNCPSNTKYTAPGNKNFDIHCGQLNSGSNITSIHAQNITTCLDACAASDKGCIGIVFDSALQNGYQNCYLQNTTSVISDQVSATYAVLAGSSSSPASSPGASNSPSSSDSSDSKAWIAGPVVGGIVGLAILAGALVWWQRRKNARGAAAASMAEKDGRLSGAAYVQPTELGGDYAREMAAGEHESTVKYAHQRGGSGDGAKLPPQELPT